MSELVTVGIDLAKSVFQIHGVDDTGQVLVRRQLRRNQLGTPITRRVSLIAG